MNGPDGDLWAPTLSAKNAERMGYGRLSRVRRSFKEKMPPDLGCLGGAAPHRRFAGSALPLAQPRMDARVVQIGLAQRRVFFLEIRVGPSVADRIRHLSQGNACPAEYRFSLQNGEIGDDSP